MAEKKVIVKVPLPAGDYSCQGEQKFYRGFVGAGKGPSHKYEYRMPIPTGATVEELEADAQRLYGPLCTLDLLVRTAVLNFATKADGNAKLELGLIAGQFDHESDYDEDKHVLMQLKFEEWNVGVRERKAVTPEEQAEQLADQEGGTEAMIAALKAKGLLPDDFALED